MGKDLKEVILGNLFGCIDFGRFSNLGKLFVRLNENILIIVILWF